MPGRRDMAMETYRNDGNVTRDAGISTGSARRDYQVRGQPMRRSGAGDIEVHDRGLREGRHLTRGDETGSSGKRARTAAGRRAAAQYESRGASGIARCRCKERVATSDAAGGIRCAPALPHRGRGEPRFGEPDRRPARASPALEGAEGIGSGREAGAASLPDARNPPRPL